VVETHIIASLLRILNLMSGAVTIYIIMQEIIQRKQKSILSVPVQIFIGAFGLKLTQV
jgi:hypothetical protein